MTTSEPLRWGVLAPTATISRLAVLPALAATPTASIVALASAADPAGEGYDHFGAARIHPSYEALLADPAVEAVYVPLPNHLHERWTVAAAAAGKHVLCEKPLAPDAAAARRMAAACARAGVVLMEAYMTPFHPRSEALAVVLGSGRLGPLRTATAAFTGVLRDPDNHRWSPEAGGGALLDVGIYCLAPLVEAAGCAPARVAAAMSMTPSGVDATTAGWLDFGTGFTAAFECSFEAPERQRIEFVGTDAAVTVERTFTPGPDDTRLDLLDRDGHRETVECGGGDPYRLMVEHVHDVVRTGAVLRRTPAASVDLLDLHDRLAAAAERHPGGRR